MNQSLFNYVHQYAGRNPLVDGIVIFFASYVIYLMVAAFLLLVLLEDGLRRRMYLFCEGALAVILARGLVTETIYFFYDHLRPFAYYGFAPLISESGPSFPSGHMTILFALATVVWFVNKKWGILFFLLSLAVGGARIYAGVHWPYDIIGGALIGIVCATIVHLLLRKNRKLLYEEKEMSV